MTKQITKAQFISEQTEERFFQDYAELFAHFNVKAFMESLSSFLQLNYTVEELQAAPITPGAYRKILALSTITLLNRDAVIPLTDLNELAENDLAKLRWETNIDLELIVPTPKPPTVEELLEAEVRKDFAVLSSSKMMAKRRNNRDYEATYQRIADILGSSVTSLRIAGS